MTARSDLYIGSSLGRCHKVEALLGEGSFGCVAKCRNTETNKVEAIKVNKCHPNILRQAIEEIEILERLQCLDPDTCNIVRWNDFFFHKDSICLNFELLDQSLLDFMNNGNSQGLPITQLQPVLHQLATALSHLKSLGIAHADLKPENIMVVDRHPKPLRVKLIDFGLAFQVSALQPGYHVGTTWYMAPEIMLQIPYNEAIDMWSLGQVAVQLATGLPLYPGNMDYDMLNFIVQTQGQPADHVLERGHDTPKYFERKRNCPDQWRFKTPMEFAHDTGMIPEDTRCMRLNCLNDLEQVLDTSRGHHSHHHMLVNLIKRMLQLDADLRITPLEVPQHPFFDTCIETKVGEEVTIEIDPQPSAHQTQPEGIHSSTSASLAAQSDDRNTEVDIQPETTAQSGGWLTRFVRRITGAFSSLLHHRVDKESSTSKV